MNQDCVPRPPEHPEFEIPVCRMGTPHCQVDHGRPTQDWHPTPEHPDVPLEVRHCRSCGGFEFRFGTLQSLDIHPLPPRPPCPRKDFGPWTRIATVPW